jgi:AcrR family transcriptional regulator
MSRADQQARTRAALLAAGTKLFARRGYHDTTIDEVARRAGFTRGAFYANFLDKGDLFLTILEAQRERNFGQLSGVLDDAPGEEVPARISDWMNQVLIGGPLRRAMAEFALAAEASPPHRRRLAADLQAIRDTVAAMVGRYRARHNVDLAVDDDTFATMITALVGGFADLMRIDPNAATPDTVAHALSALWAGVQR